MSISIQKAEKCPPLPMCALAGALFELLNAGHGLVQPHYVTISNTEHIGLQFEGGIESYSAIADWAQRFGGEDVLITISATESGVARWINSAFGWHGITVDMYSKTPLDLEPEHCDCPHEPGRLTDCPACMARCHCTPDTGECVYDGPHRVPPF